MIKDGLTDEDILHALGYVAGAPAGFLPNGHEHSNQMTTEQEEKEAQAAMQPGVGMGDEEGSGEGGGGDLMGHLAGIFNHISGKQPQRKNQR